MTIDQVKVNDPVMHVVNFDHARSPRQELREKRVAFEAVVVAVKEQMVDIRFRNGIVKRVSPASLTKVETN